MDGNHYLLAVKMYQTAWLEQSFSISGLYMDAKGVNTSKFKSDKDVFVPVDEKKRLATIVASVEHANFLEGDIVFFGGIWVSRKLGWSLSAKGFLESWKKTFE